MTAAPRRLAAADGRPDNPDRFRPARDPSRGSGRGTGPRRAPRPRVRAPRVSPEAEHRFRPKWNIHSGGSGTPLRNGVGRVLWR